MIGKSPDSIRFTISREVKRGNLEAKGIKRP
jgi:hypothetical protein